MEAISRAHSLVGYNPEGRPENDFYPTPREGTLGLLSKEIFHGWIWEPACGDGAMSKVLEEAGYDVVSSDIEPRGYGTQREFLTTTFLMAPNVITNPPFILAQEFATHALDLGAEKVALLCKLAFLETIDRTYWLETTPLESVWVFRKRLQLTRNGVKMKNGGMIAFAWFVWDKDYIGRPHIGWI